MHGLRVWHRLEAACVLVGESTSQDVAARLPTRFHSRSHGCTRGAPGLLSMLLARRPAPRPVVPRRRPATTRASAEPSAAAAPAPKLVGDESVGADGLGPLPIPSYDAAAWARHRSPARYLRHAVTAPTSAVLRNLLLPASLSCVFTAALAAYSGLRPAAWPPLPAVGLAPLGLTSSALSLLLVFRTNSSYQRFVEARTAWGAVVNRCRDLVRECCTFFGPEDAPARAAVARWAVAFAHSARCHMREPPHVLGQQLAERGVLRPGELAALVAARHRPNYCLMVLGGLVAARVRDPSVALRMDEDVRALGDSLGALERLYKTPSADAGGGGRKGGLRWGAEREEDGC